MILHITSQAAWQQARNEGIYRGDTLESEGFIHCSTREQLTGSANTFFHGRTDLLLLCIEPGRVLSEIRYEHPTPGDERLFPHIYGPLNLNAVVEVLAFPPEPDGSFSLPEVLQGDGG